MKILKRLLLVFLLSALGGCYVFQWHSTTKQFQTHLAKGEYDQAVREAEKALMIVKENQKFHFRLASSVIDLAYVLLEWASDHESHGRFSEAESLRKRALSTFEENLGSDHIIFADMLVDLALIHRKKGENDEAEALLKRSLSIADDLHAAAPSFSEAEAVLNRSLIETMNPDDFRAGGRDFSRLHMRIILNLGEFYHKQGQYALSVTPYERAYKNMKALVGENHPLLGDMMERLADVYEKSGEKDKARQLKKRADKIWSIIVDQIGFEQNKKVKFLFDEREWRVGYAVVGRMNIVEYVLHDESVHTWTELITVQSDPKIPSGMTPEQFASRKAEISTWCPNCIRIDVPSNDEEIMYEIDERVDSIGGKKEFGIGKMMYVQSGVHSVEYLKRSPLSVEERSKWIDLIGKATIIIPSR